MIGWKNALMCLLLLFLPSLGQSDPASWEWCAEHALNPNRPVAAPGDKKPHPLRFYRTHMPRGTEQGKLQWREAENTSVTETWLGEFDSVSVYSVIHWRDQYAISITLASGSDTDSLVTQYAYDGYAVAPESMRFSSMFRKNDIPIITMQRYFNRAGEETVFILKPDGFLLFDVRPLLEKLIQHVREKGYRPRHERDMVFLPFNGKLATPVQSLVGEELSVALSFRVTRKGCEVTGFEDGVDLKLLVQDEYLNEVYNLLSRQLPRNRWLQLVEEQRKWIAERDRECGAESDEEKRRDCVLEQTKRRSSELAKLARFEWVVSPASGRRDIPYSRPPDEE